VTCEERSLEGSAIVLQEFKHRDGCRGLKNDRSICHAESTFRGSSVFCPSVFDGRIEVEVDVV